MTEEKEKSDLRGQMQPFSQADVLAIRGKLTSKREWRDLAMFETAISTALRGCDLIALRVGDVLDGSGSVSSKATVRQCKTGKLVAVPLTLTAREAISRLLHEAKLMETRDAPVFQSESNFKKGAPISPTAFRRRVKVWADLAGHVDKTRFSGHSTRRTLAAHIYARTKDIASVSRLLGHASAQHTMDYLNVSDDSAHALALAHAL